MHGTLKSVMKLVCSAAVVIFAASGCAVRTHDTASTEISGSGGWQRHFEPGVFIRTDEYDQGSKKKRLAEIVVESVTAIVNRDRQAFSATMEAPGLAEQYDLLLKENTRYRFDKIKDMVPLGGDPNVMNVTVQVELLYENGAFEEKNWTYTLRPDRTNQWKIAMID